MGGSVDSYAPGSTSYQRTQAGQTNFRSSVQDAIDASRRDGKIDGDERLNRPELESLLERLLGQDLTPEQAEQLIRIYGNDGTVSTATVVEVMTSDGFLVPVPGAESVQWRANWDSIPGVRIADALFRIIGLDPAKDRMTATQFKEAMKKLFGDDKGLSKDNAGFLTRYFGTANSLSREEIADVFNTKAIHLDGVPREAYTRVFVNLQHDGSPFLNNSYAANYIMSFDGNGDGMINRDEFKAALQARAGDGIKVTDAAVDQFMAYYGFNDGGGQRVLNLGGVQAMLRDTSLYLTPLGERGAQGFGINLNITSPDRVIRGMADMDPESRGDGVISKTELVNLMKQFGLDLTDKQAEALMKIYGNGTSMTLTDFWRMQDDGFFTPGAALGQGATLYWNNIDGQLIAAAVFRGLGLDPADPNARVDATQFNNGLKLLFGDDCGHTIEQAVAQTRAMGTRGTLSVSEMGRLFDHPSLQLDGVAGKNHVSVTSDIKGGLPLTDDKIVTYLMTFDGNGDGILQKAEFERALKSWAGPDANLSGDMVTRLSRLYSFEGADGNGGLSIADLETMVSDRVLVARGAQEPGFRVNLEAVPLERLIDRIFLLVGKNPATDKLTARDLDEGTDHIFGDWKPLRADSAKKLAAAYGDSEGNLEWGQVYDIFASGAIQFGQVGDRSFMPITVHLDIAEKWSKDTAEGELKNRGRDLEGTAKDPAETFKDKPDTHGSYFTKYRYDDYTTIEMEYSGSSIYPIANQYTVLGATITVREPGWSGQVTVRREKDGSWKITSADPEITARVTKTSEGYDVLIVEHPDHPPKYFVLKANLPVEYFQKRPSGIYFSSEKYKTPDNPADDLAVTNVTELGPTRIRESWGTTIDVVAFEVELADGSKKIVYVERSADRSPEKMRELAMQLGTKYGQLSPELRNLIKDKTIVFGTCA